MYEDADQDQQARDTTSRSPVCRCQRLAVYHVYLSESVIYRADLRKSVLSPTNSEQLPEPSPPVFQCFQPLTSSIATRMSSRLPTMVTLSFSCSISAPRITPLIGMM